MRFKGWLREWEGNNPVPGQNYNGPAMTSRGVRSKLVADDAEGGKDDTDIPGSDIDMAKTKFGFKPGDDLLKMAYSDRSDLRMKKKMKKKMPK